MNDLLGLKNLLHFVLQHFVNVATIHDTIICLRCFRQTYILHILLNIISSAEAMVALPTCVTKELLPSLPVLY